VVLEDRRRDRDEAGHVVGGRPRSRLDVRQVRGGAGLGPVSQKEDVEAAELGEARHVAVDLRLQIAGVGAEGREALHLPEEVETQQPLEITHEAEAVVGAQRRQRVLGEDVQA
jgi:hypothetical protein